MLGLCALLPDVAHISLHLLRWGLLASVASRALMTVNRRLEILLCDQVLLVLAL